MINNINVIDLDKTLIPYDSFGKLIKKEIVNFNLPVIYFTIFRVLRCMNSGDYKGKITRVLSKKYNESYFKAYGESLFTDIDQRVMDEIKQASEENITTILLSASPDIYVKYLIQKLGWTGAGSYFTENGNFVHLHGSGKINWIKKHFPTEKYCYNLAISDSSTDDEMLKLFKKEIKWILH